MTAILKKELRAYFNSLIGYVFLTIFVLITGIMFSFNNLLGQSAAFTDSMSFFTITMLILMPVLTMRLFAEENRQKTDQLLYTSPVTVLSIVTAKYLAALLLMVMALAVTLLFPFMISTIGTLSYVPQTITTYIGYFLLFSAYISVGVFISALTDNQLIAAVCTFLVILMTIFMDSIASGLASGLPATPMASVFFIAFLIGVLAYIIYDSTRNFYAAVITVAALLAVTVVVYILNPAVLDGFIVKTIKWFSVMGRFNSFSSGIINVADIVYYISFSAAFLYFSVNVIEKRRWR
jgi:ABC-2 type transport system permease protein